MNDLLDLLEKYWRMFKGDMNHIGNEFTAAGKRAQNAVNQTKRHYKSGQILLNNAAGIDPNAPPPPASLDELYRGPGKMKKLLDQLAQ
jgi:hypothetical protein